MRPYGKKKCLISPCECCHSEAAIAKVKGNKSRARRDGKKEIKDVRLQDATSSRDQKIK